MSYRDDDDPFEEDIVFDQAGLLSTSRKSSKSAIRRVSSGKCAMFSKTLGLCGAFLGLGLTFAIPGPLSPVPPAELRSDITLMTYEVMYRCQGFMIGAMFGARLLDRFNRLFLVFLALLVTALLVTIIPWCGINWLLRTDMFLLGVSLGFLTTGGNVLCLDLWGRNSGPFMQALHFSFSLGIFLAPFLSQPLMVPIDYSVVTPSTTPAMFPLHRLPRDVGNLSSVGTHLTVMEDPLHHPSSSPFLSLAANKSLTLSTGLSTASSLYTSVPTKANWKLPSQSPTKASGAFNSSVANATLSMQTKTSSLFSPTVPSTSKGAESISSLQPSNQSTIANSASTASSPLVANTSDSVNTSKTDISTTTHRAPRPKPVLVNSDKLQDKKWENEKFRKPPPEDLVPVSTTMKAMIRPNNKTVTSGNLSTSIPPPVLPQNISTADIPLNSTKLTKALSVQPTLNGTAASNSTLNSPSSSIAPQVAPVSSIAPALSTSSIPLVIKSTSSLNGSVNTSSQIPSTVLSESSSRQLNGSAGISVPISSTLPVFKSIPEKSNKSSSTSPRPETHALGNTMEVNLEKGQGSVRPESTHTDMPSSNISSNSEKSATESGKILPLQVLPSSNSSAGNGGINKHVPGKLLPPISKDHKSGNNSHGFGKSISVDEQEVLAPNVAEMTQSTTSAPQKKHLKATNTTGLESQVQSFGGSHVKAILKAKTLPPVVGDHGSQTVHPHMESAPKQPERSAGKYNNGDTLHSITTTPASFKTSPHIAEDPVYVEPSISPKRTHHSKPASTVVNDTEVIHTVIDTFANRLEKYGLSRMALMYLTVGMVLLATSLLFLGFLCFNPRDPKSKTDEEDMNGHVARGGTRSRSSTGQMNILPSRCLRHTLIGLMLLLLMVTSGVQAMYGQLLMVYAIQPPLQLSQSSGSALTATFWGALTSTRFACILLASALSPTSMLVLSVAICSCATWLLSAFASSSEVALWIGSVMVSVGTASVFPSGMLWMQRHVLITHRTAAMLVMGPAMGEMFFPTLAYKMMVSMGPASLIHLPALLSLFAIALWAATWRLARYPRQSLCSHVEESSGYQLANQNDEDDLLDLTMSPLVNGSGTISRNSLRSTASAHSVHRMSA